MSEHFIGHGRRQGRPKRAFASQADAEQFAAENHGARADGCRAYRCSFCGQWHNSAPRGRQ